MSENKATITKNSTIVLVVAAALVGQI